MATTVRKLVTWEALVHNLLALVYVVGPEAAIVKSLRQWGA